MERINVVMMDLGRVKECVTPNDDGTYTVLINDRLSYEGRVKAYEHAMRHIYENDFEAESVQLVEAAAHK